VLSTSQYGTNSGTTHIKATFSLWTSTGNILLVTHFAALTIVTQLIHIFQFFHEKQCIL